MLLAVVTMGEKAHFIIILGINPAAKRLSYADPNNPNAIFTTNYVISKRNGKGTINMGWNGQFAARNGWVVDLMQVWSQGIKAHYSMLPGSPRPSSKIAERPIWSLSVFPN